MSESLSPIAPARVAGVVFPNPILLDVFRLGGRFFSNLAPANSCTHKGGPICEPTSVCQVTQYVYTLGPLGSPLLIKALISLSKRADPNADLTAPVYNVVEASPTARMPTHIFVADYRYSQIYILDFSK